ncbi:MAG: hypothetical protein QM493_02860 [Sulfurovum sp.]
MVRIFVEGIDDEKFIIQLLADLKNSNEIDVPKAFKFGSVINRLGGKRKLLDATHSKYNQVSKLIEIGEVEKVLFIFDCDFETDDKNCNSMKKSKECFDKLLQKLNWNIETDVHIFDKNLDYFLLETINDKECYEDFDNLVKCLEIETLKPNKKPIANLYRDLYPYPKFDFKDDRFRPLKNKLQNLLKSLK